MMVIFYSFLYVYQRVVTGEVTSHSFRGTCKKKPAVAKAGAVSEVGNGGASKSWRSEKRAGGAKFGMLV